MPADMLRQDDTKEFEDIVARQARKEADKDSGRDTNCQAR
jgi:hypothetical protein